MDCGLLHSCDAFIVHTLGSTGMNSNISLPFSGLFQRKGECISVDKDLTRADMAQYEACLLNT